MTYLSLLLGFLFKSSSIWNPILEKVGKKLARWKKLQLSKGGRTNLIKDMLSSIPTYFMSLFMISTLVANKLEKFQSFPHKRGRFEHRETQFI